MARAVLPDLDQNQRWLLTGLTDAVINEDSRQPALEADADVDELLAAREVQDDLT